jgi:thioester reductase-like protein
MQVPHLEMPSTLDLRGEVVLDESIRARGACSGEMSNILLTGATGYLGAFLLGELLQSTAADVHCLVRADNEAHARHRIRSCLENYAVWDDRFATQIVPLAGDVAKPNLGLSPSAFDALAERCDTIFHSAATVNFVFPYRALKAANVSGTREILRLSSARRPMRVHFVSTIGIFLSPDYRGSTVYEDDPLAEPRALANGYSQSKWVGEQLMKLAAERGIPVTVYRPGFVGWHSRTGVFNEKDFVSSMMSACFLLGKAPQVTMTLDVTPVDYVARAMTFLAQGAESVGKTYHLNNPFPWSWVDLVEMCRAHDVTLDFTTYEAWRDELQRRTDADSGRFMAMLPERLDGPGSIFRALEDPPKFAFDAVRRDLTGAGIEITPLEPGLLRPHLGYRSAHAGRRAS